METIPATAQDDSSGANPSSVKSDDSSPCHEGGRGSPPPNCAICLGACRNKSFTDSCLHQFCFKCLLTWSKVKAECPLCKQNFRSIIHNVRANNQYEEYMVEQRHTEETAERIDIDNLTTATRRFRYRTTLTLPRRDTLAIQQLLLHYPLMADVFPPPAARAPPARRRRSPAAFRRTVYRHNLWARPLPDFTGRFRDCTPEFYRYNDTQMHRLVPWINRELHYLLNENIGHISYVLTRILELLPQCHINSPEFREAMQRYFGDRTEHFLHELYCFASTPYDMTGYDRNVQYTTDTRISTMINEVISSSESDASVDSDIVMVSSSEPAEPPPGPSRLPAPVYPQNYIPPPPTDNVIPIETISQSDTDDDSSEVMVVGYIKPPQDRTPEVVDLLGSDSDVIVQDNVQPEPSQSSVTPEARPHIPLVKIKLKRQSRGSGDSDSEDSTYRPPARWKRRRCSRDTATTCDTCRTTPSPASELRGASPAAPTSWELRSRGVSSPTPGAWEPRDRVASPPAPAPPSAWELRSRGASPPAPAAWEPRGRASPVAPGTWEPRGRGSPPSWSREPSPGTDTTDTDSGATTTSSSGSRRKRLTKKKSKRKTRKENIPLEKGKKKSKKRSTSRSHHKDKKRGPSVELDKDKRSKRKSHSGKGVKSSKKTSEPADAPPEQPPTALDQPGPSGTAPPRRRAASKERRRRRASRESKRLKSVVNVINSHKNSRDSSPSINSNLVNTSSNSLLNTTSNSGSVTSEDRTRRLEPAHNSENYNFSEQLPAEPPQEEDTDSEDNLPLNLTVQKVHPLSSLPVKNLNR